MSEKSGCVPLHWQHCRVSVSMSVLLARDRARTGHSFQTVRRHDFSSVASRGKEAAGAEEAYEWFEFVCAVETRRAVVR